MSWGRRRNAGVGDGGGTHGRQTSVLALLSVRTRKSSAWLLDFSKSDKCNKMQKISVIKLLINCFSTVQYNAVRNGFNVHPLNMSAVVPGYIFY